ncbi:hypothetical protein [Streptomyces sp. NPDC003077]|uniref:hypothetical protein n=1 Tax=Streptomyces sp. NPDC003077 TaxID=3154443 RepID=UPI0033B2A3CD
MTGGVLSTGPDARITYRVAVEAPDAERLLAAVRALREALRPDGPVVAGAARGPAVPVPGVPDAEGADDADDADDAGEGGASDDLTALDDELAAAEAEAERTGDLAPERRRRLRDRLELGATALAASASVAALAESLAHLL